jgi:hypothetical protein
LAQPAYLLEPPVGYVAVMTVRRRARADVTGATSAVFEPMNAPAPRPVLAEAVVIAGDGCALAPRRSRRRR